MSIAHATLTVERRLAAPRAHVFAAWQGPSLHQWYLPAGKLIENANDFQVGGRQMHVFGPEGGPVFRTENRYEDIVVNERIVAVGSTFMNDARASTTLCTVELRDDGDGTLLILTDQSVYYLGDYSEGRREGWRKILGDLDAWLQEKV
jgi:uncharacterized protein YndB with AHSA1/START domain